MCVDLTTLAPPVSSTVTVAIHDVTVSHCPVFQEQGRIYAWVGFEPEKMPTYPLDLLWEDYQD